MGYLLPFGEAAISNTCPISIYKEVIYFINQVWKSSEIRSFSFCYLAGVPEEPAPSAFTSKVPFTPIEEDNSKAMKYANRMLHEQRAIKEGKGSVLLIL